MTVPFDAGEPAGFCAADRDRIVASSSGRTPLIRIAAGLLAAAATGIVLVWYGLSGQPSAPEPDGASAPLIRAESGPIKERPADPGGLEIADRDKQVYRRFSNDDTTLPVVERLLPPPEEPQPVPAAAPPPPTEAATALATAGQPPADGTAAAIPGDDGVASGSEASGGEASGGEASGGENGPATAADNAALAALIGAAIKDSAAGAVADDAADVDPDAAAAAGGDDAAPEAGGEEATAGLTAEGVAPAPVAVEQAPAAGAKPVVPAQPPQAAVAGGSHFIQIASVPTRQAADAEWARLSRRHADLLGGLAVKVVPVTLGEKGTYFRVRGGPLAGADRARSLCQALAARNVGCLVVRPNG